MKLRTILVLFVVVLVLLWLTWERKKETKELTELTPEHAMFEGLRPERVRSVRIDHLQRGVQLLLERDETGAWFMTEPVPYPAEGALVRTILDQLAACRGPIDAAPNLEAQSLDRPVVVLEVRERLADGEERDRRVEIGSLDIDERLINVRVPGHPAAPEGQEAAVLRVSRSLRTTLDRNYDDYRDTRATHLRGQNIVALSRRGAVQLRSGEVVPLALDARLASTWRRTDPPAGQLDPTALGWLTRAAAELRIERFVDDSPADLTRYWLQDPAFTVEIEERRGQKAKLLFSYDRGPGAPAAEDATWYAMREGFAHVWGVDWRDIRLLASPAGMLVDTRILHALREDVLRVELAAPDRTLVLELEDGSWWVTEERTGSDPARYPADAGAVEDLLATLEQAELGDCPPELDPPGDTAYHVAITTRTGERFGGAIGDEWHDPETGAGGRVYLRIGDELLQLVEDKVAALWTLPLDELRSLVLFEVSEFLVDRVRITKGDAEHLYYRDQKEWREATSQMTVPLDTQILIGDLMHIVATEWVGPVADGAIEERIEVRLVGRFPDREKTLVLARDGEGQALVVFPSGEAARLDPDLHGRLSALFR